ncbi:asparaginase [Corynebacterium ulceribovis]|uniref:asparaginase n=1 Tax=Corynebacterium ulceribovis TaxID=487732 RepID=UPI0003825D03|nr:asparaginase [Corynebacterium ulceribovis]
MFASESASPPATSAAHFVVLTTGGTIACTTDADGHLVPNLTGRMLVDPVVSRFAPGSLSVDVRDIALLDSSSLTFSDIDLILSALHDALADPKVDGVLITHGTDALEETAMALDLAVDDERPVILTGAIHASDHPQADGPENIFEALLVAMDESARGAGPLVVFGHEVLPARGVVKTHTEAEKAFGSTVAAPRRSAVRPLAGASLAGTRVDIITAYPGADGGALDAAIAAGAQGVVIEAMGSGNVGIAMADAVERALDAGVPIVVSTRVPFGPTSSAYGGAGGGGILLRKGAVLSQDLRAPQARMVLAASIATGTPLTELF